MSEKKYFEAAVRVPLEILRRAYRELSMTGDGLYVATGIKRNEKLLSLNVKFENKYSAEINAYPGNEGDKGYVEVVLFDSEGRECCSDPSYENIMGHFFLSDENMTFSINVLPEEKYVLVNRSVYDANADTNIVETIAVNADWLAHQLWWKETTPMNTLSGFLEEYTTEDVDAWYSKALFESAIAFSLTMPGSALQFEWAMDDDWKAEALLETMDKFGFNPKQMLDCLHKQRKEAE